MSSSDASRASEDTLPWARVSLKLSAHRFDTAAFARIVDQLGHPSSDIALRTNHDTRVWIAECPLPSDAPAGDQFAWAVDEAEVVFGGATTDLTDCQLEVRVGIAVGAQLGLVFESGSLARLARLSVDIVFDLYGWD